MTVAVEKLPHCLATLRIELEPDRVSKKYDALAGEYAANFNADGTNFAAASQLDYRLKTGSRLIDTAVEPGVADGVPLRPEREYVHPRRTRKIDRAPLSPGAFQSIAP